MGRKRGGDILEELHGPFCVLIWAFPFQLRQPRVSFSKLMHYKSLYEARGIIHALHSLTSDYLSDFTVWGSSPHPLCDCHLLCTNHSHIHSVLFFHLESFPPTGLIAVGLLPHEHLILSLFLRVGPGDQ